VQSDYERSSGDYDSSGGDHGGSDRNSKVMIIIVMIMVSVVEIGAIMRIAMTVAVIAIIMLKS
jgi:hypothetical protein